MHKLLIKLLLLIHVSKELLFQCLAVACSTSLKYVEKKNNKNVHSLQRLHLSSYNSNLSLASAVCIRAQVTALSTSDSAMAYVVQQIQSCYCFPTLRLGYSNSLNVPVKLAVAEQLFKQKRAAFYGTRSVHVNLAHNNDY